VKIIDPSTGRLTKRARLADFIDRYVVPPLAAVSAVSGVLLTYPWETKAEQHPGAAALFRLADDWMLPIFITFSFATFLLSLARSLLRPAIETLQRKVDVVGQNFRALCDGLAADFALKLGILPGDNSRVSIYIHDGERHFVLCGRHSPNPIFQTPGRPYYPDDQGCIAQGWQHSWWFENNLGVGKNYMRATQDRYGISPAVTAALPMKSKMFGAKRIDHGQKFIGIVMVESMRVDRFAAAALQVDMERFVADIAPVIASFQAYAPSPAIAARRGF
jgi:hypothetical protein